MSVSMIITRPDHDDVTHYLHSWSEQIISEAESKNVKVVDLEKNRAIRREVENVLEKIPAQIVIFNGHGSDSSIAGHNFEVLIKSGENESLLKSKIVYAISCSSGKILGPKSIDAGAISFTGYDDVFFLAREPIKISRPLEDGLAELFLKHSNVFVISLIKGNSVSDSFEKSKFIMKENFTKLLAGGDSKSSVARYLWWNYKHFVSHGNLNATI